MFAKCTWVNSTDKYIQKNQSLIQTEKLLNKLDTNRSLSSRHKLDKSRGLHISMTQTSIYCLNHLTVSGTYGAWLYDLVVPLGREDMDLFFSISFWIEEVHFLLVSHLWKRQRSHCTLKFCHSEPRKWMIVLFVFKSPVLDNYICPDNHL